MIVVRGRIPTEFKSEQGIVLIELLTELVNQTANSAEIQKQRIYGLGIAMAKITGQIYRTEPVSYARKACLIVRDDVGTVDGKPFRYPPGTVIVLGAEFRQRHAYTLPAQTICLYERDNLGSVYIRTDSRIAYSWRIGELLKPISSKSVWSQCPQKYLSLNKLIGSGCYGNVYEWQPRQIDSVRDLAVAVKISKLKPEAKANLFSPNVTSWRELYILENILRPIISQNICPNLPLLHGYLLCESCRLVLSGQECKCPCITTVIELADGSLKDYLSEQRDEEEIRSALFQILAGIHAVQKHGQIMNYDVKKENILYYNVPRSGYWLYTIRGRNYYVPNCGKIFILNDFGIATSFSPLHRMYRSADENSFRLGNRSGLVYKNQFISLANKADKIYPRLNRQTDRIEEKITLSEDGRDRLNKLGLYADPSKWEFYLQPEYIPPLEFFNDTQDAIRMFLGGKRTTQKGHHRAYRFLTAKLKAQLAAINNKADGAKTITVHQISPEQVLASRAIATLFDDWTAPRSGIHIATYQI